ncbi:gastrula zinc finger protein XlCGF8.2DB-like [Pimephales promelas]|nr:gastrula zinc finger protein XlCGF8.2DB-like [Pimephales promelas]
MAFIKEESEDMEIEETFSVKQEHTEEQTDLMGLKEETEGEKYDPNNYRGITVSSNLGKLFCSIINDRLVQFLQ